MIANPPNIIELLRAWEQVRMSVSSPEWALAVIFNHYLGTMSWTTFIHTYQLYLQSIPLDLARSAWGLNSTQTSTTTQP